MEHVDPPQSELDALEEMPFVRQLHTFGIGANRLQFAKRDYCRAFTQRSRWTRQSLLFDGEVSRFEKTLIEEWEPRFNHMCDGLSVNADWDRERDPTLSIERLDKPTRAIRMTAEAMERRPRAIPQAVATLPMMFAGHFEKLRGKGTVNRSEAYDLTQSGGLSGQSYYEGAFELEDEEALLLEVKAPEDCTYWSVILGDDLHRTLDWANNHSSLNNFQGKTDSDGTLRFVIAGKDPGVANWLDTAGHPQGVVQGRWLGGTSNPVPTVRKVPVEEIHAIARRSG